MTDADARVTTLVGPLGSGDSYPFPKAKDLDLHSPVFIYFQRVSEGLNRQWFMARHLTHLFKSAQDKTFSVHLTKLDVFEVPRSVRLLALTRTPWEHLEQLGTMWHPESWRLRFERVRFRAPVSFWRRWRKSVESDALQRFGDEYFELEHQDGEERGKEQIDIAGPILCGKSRSPQGMLHQKIVRETAEHYVVKADVSPFHQPALVVVRKDLFAAIPGEKDEKSNVVWEAFCRDYCQRRPSGPFAFVYRWRL